MRARAVILLFCIHTEQSCPVKRAKFSLDRHHSPRIVYKSSPIVIMSDQINWIPVAIWSAGVFVQIDSAIRWWWTNRNGREEENRLVESDWSKIQRRRDEMKRGFRMWLERRCCPKKSICHFIVPSPLPNDYDWDEWIEHEPTSIFMAIDHPMPNADRYVQNLRRYSLLAPDVYTDIARVIHPTNDGWWWVANFQLDDRTVASAFFYNMSGRICVIFIDTKQRSYFMVRVPSILPVDDGSVRILCIRQGDGGRHSNRLRIVYATEELNQREVISVDYEIRPSEKHRASRPMFVAEEVGRQSIVIPGQRMFKITYIPGTYELETDDESTTNDYIITIDQHGDFRLHHYDEWNRAIMATDIERRSRKAVADFDAMLPEQWRTKRYFWRYHKHIFGCVGASFAKRQIYAPSMMYRAAEAICQSMPPNTDLSMIKSETGIDMFDGIHEDREKPIPTIYLPNEDEL